jgi:hypothetical protein
VVRQDSESFFVGNVHAAARFADAVELLQQHIGPIEDLQRMTTGHQVELIVFEQHLRCIAIGIFDIADIEIGSDLARIFEASQRMVERHDSCRLEFLVGQYREVTDTAADVRHCNTGAHPMTR